MPCSVKFDGNAPVKDFFHIADHEPKEKDNLLQSHFHGRSLVGKHVSLPSDVQGLILGAGNGGPMQVEGNFQELIMWEHDLAPDTTRMEDCLNWFEIAKAVHS